LEFGLPYIVETIIQLKYVELESRVRKALLVLKHRASEHSNEILEYKITNKGYEIGSQYEADHVISGSAVRRAPVEGLVNYLKDFGSSMDVSIRLIEDTLIKMGQSLPEERYPSKEAFFEAIKNGEAAISKLESQPIPLGADIYGTASCPFRDTVKQLSDENNEAFVALTEKHRMLHPDAAVVHPFCVCHQNVRKIILDKTLINGSRIKSQTILCRSSALDKTAFDSQALDDIGLDQDEALKLLRANTCLYRLEIDKER